MANHIIVDLSINTNGVWGMLSYILFPVTHSFPPSLNNNSPFFGFAAICFSRSFFLSSFLSQVGQSLSIRTDLLPPAYVRGLSTLQDRVPAFDSAMAYEIMKEEWGVSSIYDVLSDITPQPIAAASLGQVYKAKLKMEDKDDDDDGTITEVAIKVQRPNISEQIALDMYLLREFAKPLKRIFNLNTDTVSVCGWVGGLLLLLLLLCCRVYV
jgi:ABC1 atypical kinase-like domain